MAESTPYFTVFILTAELDTEKGEKENSGMRKRKYIQVMYRGNDVVDRKASHCKVLEPVYTGLKMTRARRTAIRC